MTYPSPFMTNHRAAYAHRFNARSITRPRPTPPPLTDEQFEAWVTTQPAWQPAWAQGAHRAARALSRVTLIPSRTFR